MTEIKEIKMVAVGRAAVPRRVLSETRSDRLCLVERSDFIRAESAEWGRVVRQANINIDQNGVWPSAPRVEPGSLYAVQIRHAEKGHRRSEAAARLLAHEQLWVAPPASQVAHIIAPGHSCVGGMPVVAVPDEEDVGPVPVPHHSLESVRLGCGGDARYVEWCGRSN
jgi:hypothetical protein